MRNYDLIKELAVQIPCRAIASLEGRAQSVELVHMKFDLLDMYIFMIITRCLSTKYSLLLFWHYFVFQSSRFLAVLDQCTPAIVLNSPAHLVAGLPGRRCPMRGSHIVASYALMQLCNRAKCPPHFHFRVVTHWTASAVFAKALILAFGILSRRDMPKIFRSIFLWQIWIFFFYWFSVSSQVWQP